MNPLQQTKVVRAIEPVAIKDNASWTCQAIDTKGYDSALVIWHLGATDIAMAALKLQECDTSGGNYADVSGANFDGDTGIDGSAVSLPSATDDNKFFLIDVDLRKRKRYLKLTATAGDGTNGTYGVAIVILSRGKVTPNSASERGAAAVLQV